MNADLKPTSSQETLSASRAFTISELIIYRLLPGIKEEVAKQALRTAAEQIHEIANSWERNDQ